MVAGRLDESRDSVLDNIRGTHDAISVKRVFGDPVVLDGVTIIPVARVAGGAGGGGGEGTGPGDQGGGGGLGTAFGIGAHPVGVYEVRDGEVSWNPTIDVNRIVRGGQVLGGIAAVCIALVFLRRPL